MSADRQSRTRSRHLPRAAEFAHQRRTLPRAPLSATGKAPFHGQEFRDRVARRAAADPHVAPEKLRDGWSRACLEADAQVPVLFTAHSVPRAPLKHGDDYERQTKETAELVAASIAELDGNWRFAFQSQGASGGAWIGPTVESVIEELAAAGHKLFVQPIGFVRPRRGALRHRHRLQEVCRRQGAWRLTRAESLNGSKTLTAALAAVVSSRGEGVGS